MADEITTGFIDSDGLECVISEMGSDPLGTAMAIPIDANKLATIKAKDENPQFVTVAIESGWSKSKRQRARY